MRYYTGLRALLKDLPSIKDDTIVVSNTVNIALSHLNSYEYRSIKEIIKRQNIKIISFNNEEAYNEFKEKNKGL